MNQTDWYVLMADDDKDDIVLVEEVFRQKKIREKLVGVTSGYALLDYLDAAVNTDRWPRLILLDLNMPGKNGIETLITIKERPRLKKIPVVIFSTSCDYSEIARCYELGANSYVIKPVGFDKLQYTIEMIHAYWCKTVSVAF